MPAATDSNNKENADKDNQDDDDDLQAFGGMVGSLKE